MSLIKSVALFFLSHIEHPKNWCTKGPTLTILTYHRVLPINDKNRNIEQPGMVASPETLSNNIHWLKANNYSFISIDSWPEITKTSSNSRFAAITFDDGWQDNVTHALPILNKHNVPATIYCVSSKLKDGAGFWPTDIAIICSYLTDADLNALLSMKSISDFLSTTNKIKPRNTFEQLSNHKLLHVNFFIENCKKYSDKIMLELTDTLWRNLNIPESLRSKTINYRELNTMIASGIKIGSHSKNHFRINEHLDKAGTKLEIKDSKMEIEHYTGIKVTSFCYPNGDMNQYSELYVRKYYETAVTTKPGTNKTTTDKPNLMRYTMHDGISSNKNKFFSRLKGWV